MIKIRDGVIFTNDRDDTCFCYDLAKKYGLFANPHSGEGYADIEGILSEENLELMKKEIENDKDTFKSAHFQYNKLIPNEYLNVEDWEESEEEYNLYI